jgi:hypothetical protein
VATTHAVNSTEPVSTAPLATADIGPSTPPKAQPLWRFALVGLGPLTVLAVFALVYALFQRIAGS